MPQEHLASICEVYDSRTFEIARAERRAELPFNSQIRRTRCAVRVFCQEENPFELNVKIQKKVCFHLEWCTCTGIVWRKDSIVQSVAGWDKNPDIWKDVAIIYFPQPSFFFIFFILLCDGGGQHCFNVQYLPFTVISKRLCSLVRRSTPNGGLLIQAKVRLPKRKHALQ